MEWLEYLLRKFLILYITSGKTLASAYIDFSQRVDMRRWSKEERIHCPLQVHVPVSILLISSHHINISTLLILNLFMLKGINLFILDNWDYLQPELLARHESYALPVDTRMPWCQTAPLLYSHHLKLKYQIIKFNWFVQPTFIKSEMLSALLFSLL